VARKPNILRPVKLTTNLPEDLRARLDLYLFSETEGRVPHGKYSEFLSERVTEFFAQKRRYLTDSELRVVQRVLGFAMENIFQEWGESEADYLTARELQEKLSS